MADKRPAPTVSTLFSLDLGQRTDQGSRPRNEDHALTFATDHGVVVMVADGMGSGVDGQLFSQKAVERAQAAILADTDLPAQSQVERAFDAAASELHRMRQSDARYSRSGSTMVLATATPDEAGAAVTLAHVGDSRAYHIRANGQVELITTDHSYSEQLIRQGSLRAEAERDPQGQLLTHVLGQDLDRSVVRSSLCSLRLGPDDRLLLCSDGISRVLEAADLSALVLGQDAQAAAEALVRRAVRDKVAQRRDNATAVVVRCAAPTAAPVRAGFSRLALLALALALVALLAGGGAALFGAAAAPPDAPRSPLIDATVEVPPTLTGTTLVTPSASPPPAPTSTGGPSVTPTATPTLTPSPTNTPTRSPTLPPVIPSVTPPPVNPPVAEPTAVVPVVEPTAVVPAEEASATPEPPPAESQPTAEPTESPTIAVTLIDTATPPPIQITSVLTTATSGTTTP